MNSSFWAVLAAMGEKNLSISEQLLRVVFSTFCGQKKQKQKNIVASALKSCIISLLQKNVFDFFWIFLDKKGYEYS